MIHYHGGPITPQTAAYRAWASRHAFVSFAHPAQVGLAADITQSFALDNGAFSIWKKGREICWTAYYAWVWEWRRRPNYDFAVVPDVIGGTEADNDRLAAEWPFPRAESAVVWHTGESISRLVRLAAEWPRVAIGSSAEFDVATPTKFVPYIQDVLRNIACPEGYLSCRIHGLRMLNPKVFSKLPLSSADSTNVARNIGIDKAWSGAYTPASRETRAQVMVERIERETGALTLEKRARND